MLLQQLYTDINAINNLGRTHIEGNIIYRKIDKHPSQEHSKNEHDLPKGIME